MESAEKPQLQIIAYAPRFPTPLFSVTQRASPGEPNFISGILEAISAR